MSNLDTNQESIQFINITEQDFLNLKVIHKYMDSQYAVDSLKNGFFWFSNPIKWKDPFERQFFDLKYDSKLLKKQPFPLTGRSYACCFTQNASCESAWSVYGRNKSVYEFQIYTDFLLSKLRSLTNDYTVYIGQVYYCTTEELTHDVYKIINERTQKPIFSKSINFSVIDLYIKLLFLKRNAYKYENEIRILLIPKDNKSHPYSKGRKIYINNFLELIQTITITPYLKYKDAIKIKRRLISLCKAAPKPIGINRSRLLRPQKRHSIHI